MHEKDKFLAFLKEEQWKQSKPKSQSGHFQLLRESLQKRARARDGILMKEEEFRKYLKRKGKKSTVVDRNLRVLKEFVAYLAEKRAKDLNDVSIADVDAFVKDLESQKQSAKGYLYILMNYFHFLGEKELLDHTKRLRGERTAKTRRVFPLKEFLNVNQDHVKKLSSIGIKNVNQMLEQGRTKAQRRRLAQQLSVPEESILEFVKLSDITRIGYVKKKLSRLYYEAGLDSPAKIAEFEPDQLYRFFVKFVEETGWDGMVPNPKDLVNNIAGARKLKDVVEV